MDKLYVKRIEAGSKIPTRGTLNSAGFDLYSNMSTVIPPNSSKIISTGIGIQLPPGTYGRIAGRSGLSIRDRIEVGAGVIDADYRGVISVHLYNFSDSNFFVTPTMKIAQLIVEKIYVGEMYEVEELSPTERGANGFGSTD